MIAERGLRGNDSRAGSPMKPAGSRSSVNSTIRDVQPTYGDLSRLMLLECLTLPWI